MWAIEVIVKWTLTPVKMSCTSRRDRRETLETERRLPSWSSSDTMMSGTGCVARVSDEGSTWISRLDFSHLYSDGDSCTGVVNLGVQLCVFLMDLEDTGYKHVVYYTSSSYLFVDSRLSISQTFFRKMSRMYVKKHIGRICIWFKNSWI